ncbi:hypothetical protein [Rhizobium sp. NFR03]|uniref:hypothetical protein n=1 Tax=Rhizobium sp. NFR03 TaxID=1566263 RepID=UPI0008BA90CE|nr:hypothetical protein [Rhizobium sp. NFR03]SES38200.1 hypothetical protein SAMN03159406_03869 [Rhizobium sp. NFR03]
MSEGSFIVTAKVLHRVEDGTSHLDGSTVYRSHTTYETWNYPAETTIGEVMNTVSRAGDIISIAVTEDRVSHRLANQKLAGNYPSSEG